MNRRNVLPRSDLPADDGQVIDDPQEIARVQELLTRAFSPVLAAEEAFRRTNPRASAADIMAAFDLNFRQFNENTRLIAHAKDPTKIDRIEGWMRLGTGCNGAPREIVTVLEWRNPDIEGVAVFEDQPSIPGIEVDELPEIMPLIVYFKPIERVEVWCPYFERYFLHYRLKPRG
jgi:hypothetical protein